MRCKYLALLSLALLMLAVVPAQADGDAQDIPAGFYASQLDDSGRDVYNQVVTQMQDAGTSDSITFQVTFDDGLVFRDAVDATARSAAEAHVRAVMTDVLTAVYLDRPDAIWFWNLPVSSPEMTVTPVAVAISGSTDHAYAAGEVSFMLSVPPGYEGKVAETLQALETAAAGYKASSTVPKTISSIHSKLNGVKVVDDVEGKVSNAYDALVTRQSSPIGIAAAFTYVCGTHSIDAATIVGTTYVDSDQGRKAAWNAAGTDGKWYAVDSTQKQCLMVGYSVSVGGTFAANHVADFSVLGLGDLGAPSIERLSYQFPDERGFLEKYGSYVIMGMICVLLVACVVLAVRQGSF